MKFILCLSGFRLGSAYDWIYSPAIGTPALLTIGVLDPVISPAQTRRLSKHCQHAKVFEFAGTHYVPQSKEYSALCAMLTEFLTETLVCPPVKDRRSVTRPDRAVDQGSDFISSRIQKDPRSMRRRQKVTMVIRPAILQSRVAPTAPFCS